MTLTGELTPAAQDQVAPELAQAIQLLLYVELLLADGPGIPQVRLRLALQSSERAVQLLRGAPRRVG